VLPAGPAVGLTVSIGEVVVAAEAGLAARLPIKTTNALRIETSATVGLRDTRPKLGTAIGLLPHTLYRARSHDMVDSRAWPIPVV